MTSECTPQILFVAKMPGNCAGYPAKANLNGRAVLNQLGCITTDKIGFGIAGLGLQRWDFVIGFNYIVHLGDVHVGFAVDPGQTRVDLNDDQIGFFDGFPLKTEETEVVIMPCLSMLDALPQNILGGDGGCGSAKRCAIPWARN